MDSIRAFDTASLIGQAHPVAALGFQAVGLYMRPDRCSEETVEALHSVGVKVFSIWEKGEPTSSVFFNEHEGEQDAFDACEFAIAMGMPQDMTPGLTNGKPIFACVDYDASTDDDDGPVMEYMTAFHETCKSYGYLAGIYGSGQTCQMMIDRGVARFGYLDQSTGHAGHDVFLPRASLVQGSSTTVLGMDADLDVVRDASILW